MISSTVVVLGAHGFIGRHVCREVARRGLQVVGLGHGKWDEGERRQWRVSKWCQEDVTLSGLEGATGSDRATALIHCAGGSSVSSSFAAPLEDYRRSVESTADVLEFARTRCDNRVRVVLVSSAAVYGDHGDVDLAETCARTPASPYGFSKLAAENLCISYSRFFGINVSIVRLFSVFGEGLRKQLLWDAMCKYSRGEARFLGTGDELRDWVHVDDAATLVSGAALEPQNNLEIYNGGNTIATTRDVLQKLAKHAKDGLNPIFTGEVHAGNPRRLTSSSLRAKERLQWVTRVDLESGLARYARWFRSELNV